jgi:hypothetical protein
MANGEELEFLMEERRAEVALLGQLHSEQGSYFRWLLGLSTLAFVTGVVILGGLGLDALSRNLMPLFYGLLTSLGVLFVVFFVLLCRFGATFRRMEQSHTRMFLPS